MHLIVEWAWAPMLSSALEAQANESWDAMWETSFSSVGAHAHMFISSFSGGGIQMANYGSMSFFSQTRHLAP